MKLISKKFDSGKAIPDKYTCQGENISPPLEWIDLPPGTEYLALIVDDPDAPNGAFAHWVLYDIPADRRELHEDLGKAGQFPWGGIQGRNDFGNIGYDGPCPPDGEVHRYYWRLYAVDTPCNLGLGATRAQLLDWLENHTIAMTELIGEVSA
jgi:Raf kinase inhibitor-like YbhB/YbcL family protein